METTLLLILAAAVLCCGALLFEAVRLRRAQRQHAAEAAERDGELRRTAEARTAAETECALLRERLAAAEERHAAATAAAEERARQLAEERTAAETARAAAQTRLTALEERMAASESERAKAEEMLRTQFRNLANDIFGEQSRRFRETNRESLDVLLKPFRENITEFRTRVERIYAEENEQRGALKNELRNLMELNRRITTETTNLTNALKGNSKVQGDWGEMILDTILESSSLVRGIHYDTQVNLKDAEGNNLRPDVVLRLPEEKRIVIDSKVSLTAFVGYVSAETEEERRRLLAAHVASVRQHVAELGRKEYQRLLESPDFVIMFVPNEPAFLAALQADPAIWSDAYERKVIVSSPTNLFALLKLVDDLWKRNAQSRNTADIVTYGTKLYDQLVAFTSSLESVGLSLDKARDAYADAYKRLTSGNDNIIRSGERLRRLGLPTKKRHSARTLEASDLGTTEEPAAAIAPSSDGREAEEKEA